MYLELPQKDSIAEIACKVLYAYSLEILTLLPLNTFIMYYTMIAYQMRCVLKNFAASLSSKKQLDFISLLKSYNSIKSMAELLDNELSVLMFCNIIHSSGMLYFVLCFHPFAKLESNIQVLLSCNKCFITFGSYIVSVVLASLMADASVEIRQASLLNVQLKEALVHCLPNRHSLQLLAMKYILQLGN
ncbi:hypothetical protein CEXT_156851 [Caerostris extrusa]|uniref:Uncharacterized protein n=1 Tax=Caerostris extrusa TaxID=172846 RepID=A0AAV4ME97_CAEEX|nr:hypothetical protein CEXT_156851 [Caerostris extrusa]